jgi:hypothetical protein
MAKIGIFAATVVLLAMDGGARAEIEYPYCLGANGGYGAGFVTCGFTTMAQCRESVLGMGGWCQANPHYRPAPVTEGRPRRSSRRQSGS